MPNILLTQRCVRSCPYCFAKKHMGGAPDEYFKWEDLIYLADLQDESGHKEMRFLGGEPTLHPQFADFVAYSLRRNFRVVTFTSGIMSDKVLAAIREIYRNIPEADTRFSFLCNINDPRISPASETERLRLFLAEFGRHVSPGYNIYEKDFDLGFFVDYINDYGMLRTLRLGVAHPIYKKDNTYIAARDMVHVLKRVTSFYPVLSRFDITVGLDCGFPLCGLSDEELGIMHKFSKGTLRFSCEPILDISPDMTVWPCFPLSSVKVRKVYDFNSIREMGEYYRQFHASVTAEAAGIFLECDDCLLRARRLCAGGCKTHILNDLDKEPVKLRKLDLSDDK